jgi:hypothetical protein
LSFISGNNDASLLVLNGRFYTFPVTILGNAAQDALTIDDIAILMHTECSSRSGKVIIALQQTPMSAAASLVEQPTESVLIRLGLTSSDVQSHIVLLSTWLLAARSDAGLIAQKSSVQTVLGPGRTPLAPTDSSLNQAGHIRQHMHSRHLLYSFDASTGFNGIGATPSSTALLNVLAVVNPLSNGGQRMLGLLMSLRDLFSVRSAPFQMQVLFAPSESIPSDQFSALKRYYRYVFSPALVFDPQSGRRTHSEHRASFKHVPTAPIYTLQVLSFLACQCIDPCLNMIFFCCVPSWRRQSRG